MTTVKQRQQRWASYTPPLRAVLDEYARAIIDLEGVVKPLSASQFLATTSLSDDSFPDLRAVMDHVVGATHSYANYIEDALDGVDRGRRQPEYDISTPEAALQSLWSGFDQTVDVVEAGKRFSEDDFFAIKFTARWGQQFDLDQILEHAIVHILRHRRQIERWLAVM